MKTLNLKEAAAFLKLHPVTLQSKAKAGEIPGAKIGKCWVFVDVDLIEFIRSQYISNRQDAGKEDQQCSLNGKVVHTGTTSLLSIEKQYSEALAPVTKKKPKK
jgi:hypothetical protein